MSIFNNIDQVISKFVKDKLINIVLLQAVIGAKNSSFLRNLTLYHSGIGFYQNNNSIQLDYSAKYGIYSKNSGLSTLLPHIDSCGNILEPIKAQGVVSVENKINYDYWTYKIEVCSLPYDQLKVLLIWMLNTYIPTHPVYILANISKSINEPPLLQSSTCDDFVLYSFLYIYKNFNLPIDWNKFNWNTVTYIVNNIQIVDKADYGNDLEIWNIHMQKYLPLIECAKNIKEILLNKILNGEEIDDYFQKYILNSVNGCSQLFDLLGQINLNDVKLFVEDYIKNNNKSLQDLIKIIDQYILIPATYIVSISKNITFIYGNQFKYDSSSINWIGQRDEPLKLYELFLKNPYLVVDYSPNFGKIMSLQIKKNKNYSLTKDSKDKVEGGDNKGKTILIISIIFLILLLIVLTYLFFKKR